MIEKIFNLLRTKFIDKGILFLDGWSFLHFFWGIGLSRTKFFGKGNYKKVFIAFLAYEVIEFFVLQQVFFSPVLRTQTETLANIISDMGINMLGYWIGSKYWK